MKQITAIILAAMVAIPVLASAQSPSSKPASPSAKKTTTTAAAAPTMHATKGIVKSINDSTLIVTKVAGKGPETTFTVNPSTMKEGTIAAGTSVDVRYRVEGTSKI